MLTSFSKAAIYAPGSGPVAGAFFSGISIRAALPPAFSALAANASTYLRNQLAAALPQTADDVKKSPLLVMNNPVSGDPLLRSAHPTLLQPRQCT